MTKNVLAAIGASIRALLGHIPALFVLGVLYALFLAACYFFVTTREATTVQVLFTAVVALAIPVLFCALQAGCAGFAVGADTPGATMRSAGKGFWKVLLVSLPLVAVIWGGVWVFGKAQARITARANAAASNANSNANSAGSVSEDESEPLSVPMHTPERAEDKKPKVHWAYVLLVTVRLLCFGLVLPLVAIHLWLGIARNGLLGMFKGFGRVLAPQTVLTYAVGMIIFGVIPYFLLFTRTGAKGEWAELSLFGLRLALTFLCTLVGWVLTLRALANQTGAPMAQPQVEPNVAQPAQA
jgi:hypothetical protein